MAVRVLDVHAESVAAARQKIQQEMKPDEIILKETIVSEPEPKTVSREDASAEEAFQMLRTVIPQDAIVRSEAVEQDPSSDIIQVSAFTESEAVQKAKLKAFKALTSRRATFLRAIRRGSKGFLGIRRRLGIYEFAVTQPARVKITYRELVHVRADVGNRADRLRAQLKGIDDAKCAVLIRHADDEDFTMIVEYLGNQSCEIEGATAFALVDHLAESPEPSQAKTLQLLVAKDVMPSLAWKIAYESRERALQRDELTMPLSRIVDRARRTPAWGSEKATVTLRSVRKFFAEFPRGSELFEDHYQYFSRPEPLVSEADYLARCANKLICRECGQPMKKIPQGPFVQLRCDKCDITRIEKQEDV